MSGLYSLSSCSTLTVPQDSLNPFFFFSLKWVFNWYLIISIVHIIYSKEFSYGYMWRFENDLTRNPTKSRSLIQSRDLSFLQQPVRKNLTSCWSLIWGLHVVSNAVWTCKMDAPCNLKRIMNRLIRNNNLLFFKRLLIVHVVVFCCWRAFRTFLSFPVSQ